MLSASQQAPQVHLSETPGDVTEVLRKKNRYLLVTSVLIFVIVTAMPLLAGLGEVLDRPAFGAMNWAYVYGLGQIALFLAVTHVHVRLSHRWQEGARGALRDAAMTEERS